MQYTALNKVSTEAVEKATGKGWDEWVTVIDTLGGKNLTHTEIALMLYDNKLIKSGWWSQMVTVGYEYAKGRRDVGKTEKTGYELGVQKMIYAPKEKVWRFLESEKGKKLWMEGAEVEMRVKKEGERMRLRWVPEGKKHVTTLQITLTCPRNDENKTNVGFHQEKLTSGEERGRMRNHWQEVLEQIRLMVE